MVDRKGYLEQLFRWKDQKIIKVVTGVRRCGKSTLLEQYRQRLFSAGVADEQCIAINFESIESENLQEYHALYEHIVTRLLPDRMNYVFLDEIGIHALIWNNYARVTGSISTSMKTAIPPLQTLKYTGEPVAYWWLRSPGNNQYSAMIIRFDGGTDHRYVNHTFICIRPALWIKLDAVIN